MSSARRTPSRSWKGSGSGPQRSRRIYCGNEDSPHSERPSQEGPRTRRLARPRHLGVLCCAYRFCAFVCSRDELRNGTRAVSVAIGDLNGDGKPDLATANRDAGSVSVLAGTGDGSFQAKLDYATGSLPYAIAIGDLNGDGRPS